MVYSEFQNTKFYRILQTLIVGLIVLLLNHHSFHLKSSLSEIQVLDTVSSTIQCEDGQKLPSLRFDLARLSKGDISEIERAKLECVKKMFGISTLVFSDSDGSRHINLNQEQFEKYRSGQLFITDFKYIYPNEALFRVLMFDFVYLLFNFILLRLLWISTIAIILREQVTLKVFFKGFNSKS